ncbi:MAG: hypothetical protein WA110_01060 [Anaerolineaceae bacterium]
MAKPAKFSACTLAASPAGALRKGAKKIRPVLFHLGDACPRRVIIESMDYYLTPEWRISLPEGYQHRKESDHLILWTTGITVIMTVFAYSGEKNREILLANLRAKATSEDLEIIEEQEGELYRLGYLQPEVIRPGHTRLALHAFTTAPHGCLQTSFYMDRTSDLKEVLKAWQSVSHFPNNLRGEAYE